MSPKSGGTGWGVALALAAVMLAAGCRTAAPLAGKDERPADGTISGTVRGPEGVAPVRGRVVEAVELETGDTYTGTTAATGFYSIELPPGRYRLEVELAEAEEVAESPDVVEVDAGELVTEVDFVLGGAGVAGGTR